MLNTEEETKAHSAKIAPVLRQSMDHPLIVIGYHFSRRLFPFLFAFFKFRQARPHRQQNIYLLFRNGRIVRDGF